eukprot:4005256-Amphidinium_carterae.5
MDQRVPEDPPQLEQQEAVLDMDTHDAAAPAQRVFQVGDHLCVITGGGTCMKCRPCSRYVTSYKLQRHLEELGHVAEATVQT